MLTKEYIELKDLIDVNVLQNIQNQLGILTGVAFITVDYRGIPITKPTGFCEFCKEMRKEKEKLSICYKSDAHGGLESAIRRKSYIYRCPAGLADFSAPIIVDGKYLGAVLCGQVRTDFDKISNNYSIAEMNDNWQEKSELVKAYNKTTYIEFEKLQAISEIVYTMINIIAEKSMVELMKEKLDKQVSQLEKEKSLRGILEKKIINLEKEKEQGQINLHYVFNIANSLGRLSYMENAKKTEELSYTLAELIRYLEAKGSKITLKEEFHYVKKYLEIQSVRYADDISYKIKLDEKIAEVKIPSKICLSIVENAVIHGFNELTHKEIISIEALLVGEHINIIISDNGVGIKEEILQNIFEVKEKRKLNEEAIFIGKGLGYWKKKLKDYYGEKSSIEVKSQIEKGTKVIIKIREKL